MSRRRGEGNEDREREGRGGHERIRAFIAIELGEAPRCAALEVVRTLQGRPGGDGVRWVQPEALHVTLRFLGSIDPAAVPALSREVQAATAALKPFQLQLRGLSAFPSLRRPRVVTLGVVPPGPLEELAAAVERGTATCGFEPEDRRFRGHLTLGRVRERRCPRLVDVEVPAETEFDVTETVLFRSELHRSGATYTPLARIPLAPGAAPDGGPDHP